MACVPASEVLSDVAIDREDVVDKEFVAPPDGSEGMNEHTIARFYCRAVGGHAWLRKQALLSPQLPSITRLSERPNTNVWPVPSPLYWISRSPTASD
ncbi:hypothetical protein LMG29542_08004 [Paraburkholderia humisilvae]|uniref:Uncharacterized protein n=1 Tax=Paraburkholderia humisilvae TaxID=627669 RepID=A0A6J5FBJ9_9BURK|nr:hypothetical protein LMG29542_08004 [Paraburkholderia humisilvae]